MSSSRTFLALAVCAAVVASLSGCGFEPLHGKRSAASAAALETVDVSVIEDREGQLLRNRLQQLLAPRGSAERNWQLKVKLSESIERILVKESSFATRANIQISASYVMKQRLSGSGAEPFSRSGVSRSVGSYNIRDAEFEYANVIAERDAREKALQLLADDIKRRVSLWLREAAEAGIATGG